MLDLIVVMLDLVQEAPLEIMLVTMLVTMLELIAKLKTIQNSF